MTTTSDAPERVSTLVNLSRVALSETEANFLSKGLSFCPTPPHLNKTEILDDLESYFWHLHLKEYFLDAPVEGEDNDVETSF